MLSLFSKILKSAGFFRYSVDYENNYAFDITCSDSANLYSSKYHLVACHTILIMPDIFMAIAVNWMKDSQYIAIPWKNILFAEPW